ncbi:MAG TPA: hypothetical protein VHM91_06680 [Verrucomicrobiales bacterium]|nr:hypothetical protein [Verrucomicrobiales bacterium]
MSSPAGEKPGSDAKKGEPAKEEASLPADVQNFYGQVTGTVASVDAAKSEFSVKITKVAADSAKSKAPRPESLAGMTITVTPLLKKNAEGKQALDEASVAYIKGAKSGDPVTISVRASSKGVVFRLLKVPTSAGQ